MSPLFLLDFLCNHREMKHWRQKKEIDFEKHYKLKDLLQNSLSASRLEKNCRKKEGPVREKYFLKHTKCGCSVIAQYNTLTH